MKANQIDDFAFAVLGYLEQVQNTQKSRCARQLWGDIRKPDRFDRVHLDFAILHPVSGTGRYMRMYPKSDAARDLSAANSLAKSSGKHHNDSFASACCRYESTACSEDRSGAHVGAHYTNGGRGLNNAASSPNVSWTLVA